MDSDSSEDDESKGSIPSKPPIVADTESDVDNMNVADQVNSLDFGEIMIPPPPHEHSDVSNDKEIKEFPITNVSSKECTQSGSELKIPRDSSPERKVLTLTTTEVDKFYTLSGNEIKSVVKTVRIRSPSPKKQKAGSAKPISASGSSEKQTKAKANSSKDTINKPVAAATTKYHPIIGVYDRRSCSNSNSSKKTKGKRDKSPYDCNIRTLSASTKPKETLHSIAISTKQFNNLNSTIARNGIPPVKSAIVHVKEQAERPTLAQYETVSKKTVFRWTPSGSNASSVPSTPQPSVQRSVPPTINEILAKMNQIPDANLIPESKDIEIETEHLDSSVSQTQTEVPEELDFEDEECQIGESTEHIDEGTQTPKVQIRHIGQVTSSTSIIHKTTQTVSEKVNTVQVEESVETLLSRVQNSVFVAWETSSFIMNTVFEKAFENLQLFKKPKNRKNFGISSTSEVNFLLRRAQSDFSRAAGDISNYLFKLDSGHVQAPSIPSFAKGISTSQMWTFDSARASNRLEILKSADSSLVKHHIACCNQDVIMKVSTDNPLSFTMGSREKVSPVPLTQSGLMEMMERSASFLNTRLTATSYWISKLSTDLCEVYLKFDCESKYSIRPHRSFHDLKQRLRQLNVFGGIVYQVCYGLAEVCFRMQVSISCAISDISRIQDRSINPGQSTSCEPRNETRGLPYIAHMQPGEAMPMLSKALSELENVLQLTLDSLKHMNDGIKLGKEHRNILSVLLKVLQTLESSREVDTGAVAVALIYNSSIALNLQGDFAPSSYSQTKDNIRKTLRDLRLRFETLRKSVKYTEEYAAKLTTQTFTRLVQIRKLEIEQLNKRKLQSRTARSWADIISCFFGIRTLCKQCPTSMNEILH